MTRRVVLGVVVVVLMVWAVEPGGRQQVNVETTGDQSRPAVAVAGDDGLVVVWQSPEQGAGAELGIVGRLLRSNGMPKAAPFPVNSTVAGDQQRPDVFADDQGGFVVVWDGAGPGDDSGVFARRFDSSGRPLGPEFLVNSSTDPEDLQKTARIAGTPSGEFVVAWHGRYPWYWYNSPSYHDQTISGQRFDSSGYPMGGNFEASSASNFDYQFLHGPAIDSDSDGGFVLSWVYIYASAGPYYKKVEFVEYDSTGVQTSSGVTEFDSFFPYYSWETAVGKRDNRFVVAWSRWDWFYGNPTNRYRTKAKRFENGIPVGGQVPVSTEAGAQNPDVSLSRDGFVVVWSQWEPYEHEIRGRRFDGAASPSSPEILVSAGATAGSSYPRIAELRTGDVAVVWEASDDDGLGVYLAVIPFLEPVFDDGFEDGTTGNWNVASP